MSDEGAPSVSPSSSDQLTSGAKPKSPALLKHELRTPLNHIIGYSEMLIEQAQDQGLDTFIADLDRIHSAGERLLAVVNELCDPVASRKMDERTMHHEVRTPLNQVIGYAELLQEQAKELGQDSFVPDLQKVHAAGRHLLALIVENFSQLESIGADTEIITFQREQPVRHRSSNKREGVDGSVETASLLVVDDNEPNRDMLKRRLERLGYKVACAENGAEALKQLQAESFDLLLLDIIMPVMDGFEVLDRLKLEPSLSEIPVIVLSASDQLDHVVTGIRKGAKDYLTKPFNPVLLQARIGSCLERKRLRDQQASYLRQIQQEKQRSDELLHVILPHEIAGELKETQMVRPRRFDKVATLFCDVVGFTSYSDRHSPEEIWVHLQSLVEAFEQLCVRYNLEKIKTIGDAFMAAAGLLVPLENPALDCVRCGLEMAAVSERLDPGWQVRVGIHVGPVIAGVVGHRKYQYDIWGDTVNTAARMLTAARPGSVCVNKETWNLIAAYCYGKSLGRINLKGKGEQELFLVDGLRS